MAGNSISTQGKDAFFWTDSEVELLLECVKIFASNCMHEGREWESKKFKYNRIQGIVIGRYLQVEMDGEQDENFAKFSNLDIVTKERITAKHPKELRFFFPSQQLFWRWTGCHEFVQCEKNTKNP